MGFIRDFFDKQKAKSILNDYQSAIYLEDSVDNIKATLEDSEEDIDKTFSRLAYFYLTDKIERTLTVIKEPLLFRMRGLQGSH